MGALNPSPELTGRDIEWAKRNRVGEGAEVTVDVFIVMVDFHRTIDRAM